MRHRSCCDVLGIGQIGSRSWKGFLLMQARCTSAVDASVVVIVIDNDLALRNSLKFAFEIEGFSVRIYRDGAELLGEVELPRRGCLVIDYNLPGMSGLTLLDKLRERGVSMQAILITTHPSAAVCRRAAVAGISIIEKPLLGNTLIEGVRHALNG
jgi:two-component system response regulator FixJ